MSIGELPCELEALDVFISIDETILLADLEYNVSWMNPKAVSTMNVIAPLYDLPDAQSMIGQNMDFFHEDVMVNRDIMDKLTTTYRVKINIKETYIAETVITPLYNKDKEKCAYLLMLLDITAREKEDERKDMLIEQLSVPILNVWDNIYATTLIGEINFNRSEHLIQMILEVAVKNKAEHFLIDVSGETMLTTEGIETIYKVTEALKLIGTDCYIVGITPEIAMALAQIQFQGATFQSVKAALKKLIDL